jgi:hypothetical protein
MHLSRISGMLAIWCSILFADIAIAANVSLTIASCPPWKHGQDDASNRAMIEMCERDSSRMKQAIAAHLPVDVQNQHQLIQSEATPLNLFLKLNELRDNVGPGDTLFFFQMTHGGVLDHLYLGYPTNGEVFAYYTESEPIDYGSAVSSGQWISARELRDALSHFAKDTGANVLVIIEACHGSAAAHELIHNPIERLADNEKIAYLFSAGADETSTFTDDMRGARFTEEFVKALSEAESGTSLADVFSIAREATHRGALRYCNNLPDETKNYLFNNVDQYFDFCLQHPSFFDPKGLLLDITTR